MPFQWVRFYGENDQSSSAVARNTENPAFWEIAFIILASAFSLEEYTQANEHGWISQFPSILALLDNANMLASSLHCKCAFQQSWFWDASWLLDTDVEWCRLWIHHHLHCISFIENKRTYPKQPWAFFLLVLREMLNILPVAASDMAFDVLACGACLLFPRWVFLSSIVALRSKTLFIDWLFLLSQTKLSFCE